jgi:hypothetical protein
MFITIGFAVFGSVYVVYVYATSGIAYAVRVYGLSLGLVDNRRCRQNEHSRWPTALVGRRRVPPGSTPGLHELFEGGFRWRSNHHSLT